MDNNPLPPQNFRFVVSPQSAGQRLDHYLAQRLTQTRSIIQNLIHAELVLVNSDGKKPAYRVLPDDIITVSIPAPVPSELIPEKISFRILHEDEDLIIVSKPPGIVVHPACGHQSGTMVHGLLFHCNDLSGISGEQRPGIVHRLDKDTSGIMVAAKKDRIHHSLVNQFKDRKIKKTYYAILTGRLKKHAGRIDLPIGRHPVSRKKMAVLEHGGRDAVTNWRILEEFTAPLTFVELRPETGRTHQIRVHMAAMGHPVAGDPIYGRSNPNVHNLGITRLCLHAFALSFIHPGTGAQIDIQAPIWPDLLKILEALRAGQPITGQGTGLNY